MKTINKKQIVLVLGATGATGRLLVDQLLNQGMQVRAVVRDPEKLPAIFNSRSGLSIVKASISELKEQQMKELVKDCSAIASCLGHNLTLKGIYGKPRLLVTNAVRGLVKASLTQQRECRIKFILMNTTGNQNRDLKEKISFAQKIVLGLLRLLLPPHVDNEKAADFLRTEIGQNHDKIEWVVVRPDTLINEDHPSNYDLHPSPTRSAIFNAGETGRINVAHFMARLITENPLLAKWKSQMPVIYNQSSSNKD